MENKRNFDEWIKTLKSNTQDYKFYVNFDKVYTNIEKIKVELNILNSLIGSKNIENEFKEIIAKYPSVLTAIPILLAKREYEIYCEDENGKFNYNFKKMNYTIEEYVYFMKETGLFNLIENHLINNLYDYVIGVEVGLDSNGRKGRTGDMMENLVESYIEKAGYIKGKTYFKEMYLKDLENLTGLNLNMLSNNGKTRKRFDFVIIGKHAVYACECNYYSSNGSKLNETARSYKTLAEESRDIKGFKFVWFTDGYNGWKGAINNLRETFEVLDTLYNINDLENDILKDL